MRTMRRLPPDDRRPWTSARILRLVSILVGLWVTVAAFVMVLAMSNYFRRPSPAETAVVRQRCTHPLQGHHASCVAFAWSGLVVDRPALRRCLADAPDRAAGSGDAPRYRPAGRRLALVYPCQILASWLDVGSDP